MCVIAIAQTERMTKDHVEKMWNHNRDGGGVAWRDNGKVHWRKGLNEKEMEDYCLTLPLPYVAHFRIASCGGVLPELTHPFLIHKQAPLALKGSSSSPLLFHNGHLSRWKEILLNMAISNKLELPDGPWSDSRMMAWIASQCSTNILPHFDERLVVFGVKDMDIWGTGWTKVDDLCVSNQNWKNVSYSTHQGFNNLVCRYRTCKETRTTNTVYCEAHQGGVERVVTPSNRTQVTGGSPAPTTFRRGDDHAQSGDTEQETMEEVAESLRSAGEKGQSGWKSPHAALDAFNWARRLNPRAVKASTPLRHLETPVDDHEYIL